MHNRGNGKGGGIAAAGLDPRFFGVDRATLSTILLRSPTSNPGRATQVERECVETGVHLDKALTIPAPADHRAVGLEVAPPWWRVTSAGAPEARWRSPTSTASRHAEPGDIEDEFVYRNSFA